MRSICMVTTSEIFHDTRILNEANSLGKKCDVMILARKYPGQKVQKFPFRIKLIEYFRMPFFQLNIFSSIFSQMKALFKENPDIYHAHDLDGLLCAFPAALIKRKILIYDSHELWSNTYPFDNLRGIQWLLPILESILMIKVKKGITVNESIARYLKQKYHKDFLALYNTIDETKNKKSPYDLRNKFKEKKIILHLGSADEGRGMEQIIEAAKYLKKDAVLVFIGGGKTENEAKKLVKKNNLKNVFFFDAVKPEEIVATLKQADLGLALTQKISLSYYYSLPNKLFQYLVSGLPILGSNFPEFKKIILKKHTDKAGKIGEVVDPSKPKLIGSTIKFMLKTSNQKKYRRNLLNLNQNFSWKNQSWKLIKYYENL